ncbi:MAG: DUF4292 domain-containing protein [bacterium]
MRIIISFLWLCLFSVSCATVKDSVNVSTNTNKYPERNKEYKNLSFKSNISVVMKDMSNMASANINMAYSDSISMSLFGPFGIPFGKLYATKSNVVFYNIMTNQVLEGKPSSENMRTAVFLPLSYEDFIRLIRCETPGEPKDFIFDKNLNDDEILFKNISNPEYIEYAVLSNKDKIITQYQRKQADGTLLIHVFYTDYLKSNGIDFAQKQLYKFPEMDINVTMEIKDLIINGTFDKPFSFNIPSNIDRIKLDEY